MRGGIVAEGGEGVTIQRLDHVGVVVDDLAAATAFFLELGLTLQGEGCGADRLRAASDAR